MPLWGNRDQYSDAPKFKVQANTGNTGQSLYGTSVFAADSTEVTVSAGLANPGWQYRKVGTGPLKSIVVSAGGTLYANTDTVTVSGGTVNAVGNVVTNGSGVITAVNLTNNGLGFSNSAASTLAITTSTGSGATLSLVFGGRAGRIQWETLVAVGIVGDAVSFSNTSTANVANSSGTVDDSILPDA